MTTCTCRLSEVPTYVPAVNHFADCALMSELEALISGDLMNFGDFTMVTAGDPVFEIDWDNRFVVHPGVDGDTRCAL
jgi:hypothetical protein